MLVVSINLLFTCSTASLFRSLENLSLSYPNISTVQQQRINHEILREFVHQHKSLITGSKLLPILIDFHLWLDVHLSHLITMETAKELTVPALLERAEGRFGHEVRRMNSQFSLLTGTVVVSNFIVVKCFATHSCLC